MSAASIPKTVFSANLDYLRVVAVLCVFCSHLMILGGVPNDLGRFGVVLFFVHTSLVLMEALQRMDAVAATTKRLMQAFWVRRAFRIYPLSIFFVSVAVLYSLPPFPGWAVSKLGLGGVLANLFLVQNLAGADNVIAALWSLPIEVEMYLVLPFAYVLLRNRVKYRAFGMWLMAVVFAMTIPHLSWRLLCFVYGPCFTSGIVAFDLLQTVPKGMKKLPSWVWVVAILASALVSNPFAAASLEAKLPIAWVLSLFVGALYPFCEELRWRPAIAAFHWVADRSYGIYLSHTILFWALLYPAGRPHFWVRVGVLAVASLLVPAVLYRCIEQPLILLGARLSKRILRVAVPAPEPAVGQVA